MRDWSREDLDKAHARGESARPFNNEFVREFRANHGVVRSNITRDAGGDEGPAPCLILTTVGAKTLKPRMRPVGYVPFDEQGERKYIVVGSLGGRDQTPHWCYNLVAHPDAIVEVDGDTWRVRALLTEGELRRTVFAAACKRIPAYARYDQMTDRELPVFLLEVQGLEFGPDE